jgi:hypothetical protein
MSDLNDSTYRWAFMCVIVAAKVFPGIRTPGIENNGYVTYFQIKKQTVDVSINSFYISEC